MLLPHTRRLVRAMGDQGRHPWPELWPSGPRLANQSGKRFLRAIDISQGPRPIRASDLHVALDEWLLSSDRMRLSKLQRAICGCALLELFASTSRFTREAPGITTALIHLAPVIRTMPRAGVGALRGLAGVLLERGTTVRLNDFERAMVSVTFQIFRVLSARSAKPDMAALLESVAVIRRDGMSEDVPEVRRLSNEVQRCERLGPDVKRLLVVPKRKRWL